MFVIEDLDPTHLLIKADEEESMREELEVEVSVLDFSFHSTVAALSKKTSVVSCSKHCTDVETRFDLILAGKKYIQPRTLASVLRHLNVKWVIAGKAKKSL